MRPIVAALAIAIGTLAPASAMAESSSMAVEHAWARATPKAATTGAAYVTLVNNGTGDDRLVGASTPVAEKVQFHSETNENGVMKMRQLLTLDVSPAAPVVLKPGGIHMMLVGLKQQLKEGQALPLTLTFEKAGSIGTTARVGKIGAMEDPDPHADGGE